MIERAPLDELPGTPGIEGFTVRLERVFQGPLDLLLQLVREKELEIHLVSLGEVCDAFCRHVRNLQGVDVDQAADYLVVAATLLAIKSRSLLPQEEIESEEELFEPGEELVQQLLAYKALREAAEWLQDRYEERGRLLGAGGRWRGEDPAAGEQSGEEDEEEDSVDLGEVSLWDLLRHYRRLEEETGFLRPHRVRPAGRPLRAYVQDVWQALGEKEAVALGEFLERDGATREDAAFYLVALLELAKQRAVDLEQERPFGEVRVRRAAPDAEVDLDLLDEQFEAREEDEAGEELEELLETGGAAAEE